VGTTVDTGISCPQEKIISAKGYNGKVALPFSTQILGADIILLVLMMNQQIWW
jgi:hypothetical protein